jgi:hypothetical protein
VFIRLSKQPFTICQIQPHLFFTEAWLIFNILISFLNSGLMMVSARRPKHAVMLKQKQGRLCLTDCERLLWKIGTIKSLILLLFFFTLISVTNKVYIFLQASKKVLNCETWARCFTVTSLISISICERQTLIYSAVHSTIVLPLLHSIIDEMKVPVHSRNT